LAAFLRKKANARGSFPEQGVNYWDRFCKIDEYLNENVHPFVNQGATAALPSQEDGEQVEPLWLTDHGPEHITTVMRQASALSGDSACCLNPYECYLLLIAAHFHDVGNIFGREGHERKITKVMGEMGPTILGEDTLEKRQIRDIAMAHGGYYQAGDKDTISRLRYDGPQHDQPRIKLLAALLRLADELADDRTRTNRFLLDNGLVNPESLLFHTYASRLHPVTVNRQEHSISMYFDVSSELLVKKFSKHGNDVFLVDEIFSRTLKTYKEKLYCSRFLRPTVHVDTVHVRIDICDSKYMEVLEKISYSMNERGYPDYPRTIAEICPEIREINGESLREKYSALAAPGGVS
jgi:hypothetical protein